MERDAWIRSLMVITVIGLVLLILITPGLLGRPTELATLPLLIVGMSRNDTTFIVNVGAAVQAYRYQEIRLSINGSEPSANQTILRLDTYEEHTWVPADATFSIDAYLVDQQGNYFEYNVTVGTEKDADNRTVMVFTFPYESDNLTTVIRRTPPDDFRWVLPRKGTLP
ncbi:MAG TPA: hypothetical protein VF992_01425 [Thermoplasmata archaeon]